MQFTKVHCEKVDGVMEIDERPIVEACKIKDQVPFQRNYPCYQNVAFSVRLTIT